MQNKTILIAEIRLKHWEKWRRGSESNRRTRSCSPLHNHSATAPGKPGFWLLLSGGIERLGEIGAGNEIRTRDPNLGKVVLYQLSYSRSNVSEALPRQRLRILRIPPSPSTPFFQLSVFTENLHKV